jgi:hypothetical protein
MAEHDQRETGPQADADALSACEGPTISGGEGPTLSGIVEMNGSLVVAG